MATEYANPTNEKTITNNLLSPPLCQTNNTASKMALDAVMDKRPLLFVCVKMMISCIKCRTCSG